MATRPYVKKQEQIILVLEKKKRKRTYFGRGTAVSVLRPYVNKRNRLMLGEGKRKRRRKTVSKQKGSFFMPLLTTLAPTAVDLVTKLIR